MSDNIITIFLLEDVLEIIDLNCEKEYSLKHLNELLPKDIFDIDYLKLEELRQKIGNIGEQYVYECEKTRLINAGSKYADLVDRTPANNPQNGYDILSYTEKGKPIYIEVKSTMGDIDTPFYITRNEKETAKRIKENGGIYQIHRVYNIGKEISVLIYEDDSGFTYEEELWRVSTNYQKSNKPPIY